MENKITSNTKEKRLMRLYNMYYICKKCLPEIENVSIVELRNGNNSLAGFRIRNWRDCKNVMQELKKISFMEKYVDKVCVTLDFVAIAQINPEVTIDEGRKFKSEFLEFKAVVKSIVELYESLELGESSSGIDVKIPKCESLKEYMDYLKEIDFIFTQCPYLLSDEEEIKFKNVDVGSQWLTFVLVTAGTFGVLNNLAKIIEKAVAIKSHLTLLKQQEEMLETMKLKNEATQETLDVFKKMKSVVMEDAVNDLEAELGELQDGEERGKVGKTLEKLCILMDKGVEIYSSIETPNEVKALFPMSDNNPILPDNIVKLLEKKDE